MILKDKSFDAVQLGIAAVGGVAVGAVGAAVFLGGSSPGSVPMKPAGALMGNMHQVHTWNPLAHLANMFQRKSYVGHSAGQATAPEGEGLPAAVIAGLPVNMLARMGLNCAQWRGLGSGIQIRMLAMSMFGIPYHPSSFASLTTSQSQAITLAQEWSWTYPHGAMTFTSPSSLAGLSLEQTQAVAIVNAQNNINKYCALQLAPSANRFAHVTAHPAGQATERNGQTGIPGMYNPPQPNPSANRFANMHMTRHPA